MLDAEDGEIDRVGSGRDDAVFGDDAVLLAAGDDLAGEKEERAFGVVDEDQGVDLVALVARRLCATAGPDEAADVAGFGDLDLAGFEPLVEREELGTGGLCVGPNDGEEREVAGLDGFEDAEAGLRAGACGADGLGAFDGERATENSLRRKFLSRNQGPENRDQPAGRP